MSMDSDYGRILLAQINPDVRKHVKGVRLRDAWVWKAGTDHWEFHYTDSVGAVAEPNGVRQAGQPTFYWHGSAGSAYEARYNGWEAYLTKLGVKGYAE